jgi:hypothetical protein
MVNRSRGTRSSGRIPKRITATARRIAQVAVATSIGPNDLISAPPQVFDAIVELLEKQAEDQKIEERKQKLRSRLRS